MRKILLLIILSLTISNLNFAQSTKYGWLATSSWNLNLGVSYPKYISSNLGFNKEAGLGGFIAIQRNFSEHVGLRLEGNYSHLSGLAGTGVTVKNDVIAGNLDLIYYLVPCEPVSPYLGMGFGGVYTTIKNSPYSELNDSRFDYQLNLNLGAEWKICQNWKIKTELQYHQVANSKFDGLYGTNGGGILGGYQDAWAGFDFGFIYYFGYGEKSHLCDLYEGLSKVDYDKIEEIVKRYQTEPTNIDYARIEDIVKKYQSTAPSNAPAANENWVLIGVNFGFGSAKLKPESLPILYNAAQILLTNPNIKVEIQGHTDNIGSEKTNQAMSLKRAEAVKNFLVAKGVSADRLTTFGYGESKPIMDNKTEQGRELNRRIEFKVLGK